MNRIQLTPVVKQILIGCVVLFIGTYLLKVRGVIDLDNYLAMFYPKSPNFRPWQIITHMFMHATADENGNLVLSHIIFNMFGLVSFGVFLERFMGSKKFLQLFFFSGLGAILIHFVSQIVELHHITGLWFPNFSDMGFSADGRELHSSSPVISSEEDLLKVGGIVIPPILGASGAIYGVVAGFAYLFPNTEMMIIFIPYPIKAKYLVPAFIILDIVLGFGSFSWDPIAHFAHVGGALFGLALVYYWRKFDKRNFY